MNVNINTTAEGINAMPDITKEQIAVAMLGMEHDIACLNAMAHILGDMLDSDLVQDAKEVGRDFYTIQLTRDQMNMLSFAWNDVAHRASRVEKAFHAAAHGRTLS